MPTDHTQQQSQEEQKLARDLSLQPTRPPAEVPGYEAQRWLGSGAFGEVWIGVDCNTGRRVAIKFYLHRSGLDWTLMSREVEKLVFLSADRYVVQLLDVGWESDPPYYVMEYIENGSLEDLIVEHGPLSVANATEIFYEVSIGLMHAHGKGVLHCDLKPANILLDQDHKPRLADFGQSRLSHEQSPALGTLFYMAPEQADLEAVPDARWDVYALGSILYCMLTGSPPYRSEESLRAIDSATGLNDRLAKYRDLIESTPPPSAHRSLRGVDRALGEVIDRCLAPDPGRRFPNVQAVLEALNVREQARLRRPLLLLGFVGPVLLLFIMGLFGLRGYDRAMSDSETLATQHVRDSNDLTAEYAASSIADEIRRYFAAIESEAAAAELLQKLEPVADSDLVRALNRQENSVEHLLKLREQFVEDPTRRSLNGYLQQRLTSYLDELQEDRRALKLASLLLVDANGRMLAVAYDHSSPSKSIGFNYAYRTYFHGGRSDLDYPNTRIPRFQQTPTGISPIEQTHFSAAFTSTTTGLWKVAVSTPVYEQTDGEPELLGILGLTVNLGEFAYFRSNSSEERFVVLVDGRPGPDRGLILQHPLFDRNSEESRGVTEDFRAKEFRVTDDQLTSLRSDVLYRDPLAQAERGEVFAGEWIAAARDIPLPEPAASDRLVVLVQERLDKATGPVKKLGARLKNEGFWALGGVLAVILVLWYIVMRMLSEPKFSTVFRAASNGSQSTPAPMYDMTTLRASPRSRT